MPSAKKLLWCERCADKRSCSKKTALIYVCRVCASDINVVRASNDARRKRQDARAAKTGNRQRDPAFMKWVASLPCTRCGAPPPSHAHHSVHRSQGGGDRTCVPLCHVCHSLYHSTLGSVAAALAAWGIDLRAEARTLCSRFDTPADEPL